MINLSKVTGKASSIYTLDTFVQLPTKDKKVKNSNGNEITVHTFIGKDDIRKYTTEEFKDQILKQTRQKKPGSLMTPAFGTSYATLDISSEDENGGGH